MPYKKVPIYITSKDLLQIFKISAQELEEIEEIFDNPNNLTFPVKSENDDSMRVSSSLPFSISWI